MSRALCPSWQRLQYQTFFLQAKLGKGNIMSEDLNNFKGQTIVEYSLLLGIVIALLVTMTPMVKRSAQGMVRVIADELGYQRNGEQQGDTGLISSEIKTDMDKQQFKDEWYSSGPSGLEHYIKTSYNEEAIVNSETYSNLGISVK